MAKKRFRDILAGSSVIAVWSRYGLQNVVSSKSGTVSCRDSDVQIPGPLLQVELEPVVTAQTALEDQLRKLSLIQAKMYSACKRDVNAC